MAVTINLPDGIDEITLEEFMNYREDMDAAEVVKCFTGKDVSKLNRKDVVAMSDHIKKVLESNAASFKAVILVDGKEYGLIPDMHTVSYGAWLDSGKTVDISTLDKLMAIIYRPIVKRIKDRYFIEDYEARHLDNAPLMKDLTMDIVYGAELFFCTLEKKSLNIIELSSIAEVKKQVKILQSLTNGAQKI